VEHSVGVEKCLLFKVSENLISNENTVVHFQPGDFIADVLERKKPFVANDRIKDRSEIMAVKTWFDSQKIFNMMLLPLVQTHQKPIEYFILLLNLKEQQKDEKAQKSVAKANFYQPFNVNYIPCANQIYISVLCQSLNFSLINTKLQSSLQIDNQVIAIIDQIMS